MSREPRYSERYLEFGRDPMTAQEIADRLGISSQSGAHQFLYAMKIDLAAKGSKLRLYKLPPRDGEEAILWQLREKA